MLQISTHVYVALAIDAMNRCGSKKGHCECLLKEIKVMVLALHFIREKISQFTHLLVCITSKSEQYSYKG